MAEAQVVGAPKQNDMDSGLLEQHFNHDALLVKQTMRGCCQECLGCEAKSEFKVAPLDWKNVNGYLINEDALNQPDLMYALEESSCCCRLCYRDGRPFEMKVSQGGEPGGAPIVNFVKPCSFPLFFRVPVSKDGGTVDCPCCCLLPKVEAMRPGGAPLGSESRYIQDINLCVPKLQYLENDQSVYIVKPETCCGGCCVACQCCSGKGCLFIPFYFHEPASGEPIGGYEANAPQIRKVWAGFKKECCSTADTFAVSFPPGIDAKRKAGLLGMTFLLDFTVFENQHE